MPSEYYLKNKERITKSTLKWKEKNREKYREGQKKWREKNKEKLKKQRDKRRYSTVLWYNDYRKKQKCSICGEEDFSCLVFHHRNPEEKHKNVSVMAQNGSSIKKIEEEIKKCDILCQNCHAKTHEKLYSLKENKPQEIPSYVKIFREIKKTLKCYLCGENNPSCMCFHHRNPDEKVDTVANIACTHSPEKVKQEIEKCDVLCRNCHIKLHNLK